MPTRPHTYELVGPAFVCVVLLALACQPRSGASTTIEGSTNASTTAEHVPEGVTTGGDEPWRALTLSKLCKDWKGAYFPPEGHTPEDTPGDGIEDPGIACGYRPVGWDGHRVMYDELGLGQRRHHDEVRQRALYLVNRKKLTAAQAIEVLGTEYDYEHIGRGEYRGFGTIHYTLAGGGAPTIIRPGRWQLDLLGAPRPRDLEGSRLHEICASGVGSMWPARGHTPMDFPSAQLLATANLCGKRVAEPLPHEVDAATRRRQDEVRARARHLLDTRRLTPAQTLTVLEREFTELVATGVELPNTPKTSLRFRLKGGATQVVAPPVWTQDMEGGGAKFWNSKEHRSHED